MPFFDTKYRRVVRSPPLLLSPKIVRSKFWWILYWVFSTRGFSMGRKVSRGEPARVNLHWGNSAEFLCNFFLSCFLFYVSILRVRLFRSMFRGKSSPRLDSLEEIPWGGRFLHGGGARFPGIIEQTIRDYIENKFLQLKVRRKIKT